MTKPTPNIISLVVSLLCLSVFLFRITAAEKEQWSFIVLADWHNAESFARKPGKGTAWDKLFDQIHHVKKTYRGELVMLPGDSNVGKWDTKEFAGKFEPQLKVKKRVLLAGRNCYGSMRDLFAEAGYEHILMAVGDHELGGNSWYPGSSKVKTLKKFRQGFIDGFNEDAETGEFLFRNSIGSAPSRPLNTPFKKTSYAYQHRNVLFITLDAFLKMSDAFIDRENGLGGEGMITCTIEGEHLNWFENILIEARKDETIKFIIVQAHLPIIQPVRKVSCSGQFMDGGEESALWKTMRKYGVDVYLAGEVHTNTVTKDSESNLLQIVSRGNSFNNFLKIDVTDNTLNITSYNEIGLKPKNNHNYEAYGNLVLNKAALCNTLDHRIFVEPSISTMGNKTDTVLKSLRLDTLASDQRNVIKNAPIACGSGSSGVCGSERHKWVKKNTKHPVRCCSDSYIDSPSTQHYPGSCPFAATCFSPSTFDDLPFNGFARKKGCDDGLCSGKLRYYQALKLCASLGASLCTLRDLAEDCAQNTGCQYGNGFVWARANDPTESPSTAPTTSHIPSSSPSSLPTATPSASPSISPSSLPTTIPTASPSVIPSSSPSISPSSLPTTVPSDSPSAIPSSSPSNLPTSMPSVTPSNFPSSSPSSQPTAMPSSSPSDIPSSSPSSSPTVMPSASPSDIPSSSPSNSPSAAPSFSPSRSPTLMPSGSPSDIPSSSPSNLPTAIPSFSPSSSPTVIHSGFPSDIPSSSPSNLPTAILSFSPSSLPTVMPSASPSYIPSSSPSNLPTAVPSFSPSRTPTAMPSASPSYIPSASPSNSPTTMHSGSPSNIPITSPSRTPTVIPSVSPSGIPSFLPSNVHSAIPTSFPLSSPSAMPSSTPSSIPSSSPTSSNKPTQLPSTSAEPTIVRCTHISSSGVLELLDRTSALVHLDFEEKISLHKRQVVGMHHDDEMKKLVGTRITIRGATTKFSLPNQGSFDQPYDAQVANVNLRRTKTRSFGMFTKSSRLAIYGMLALTGMKQILIVYFKGPHSGGSMISYSLWIKTKKASEMILIHYGHNFSGRSSKNIYTLTLKNGNPMLYISRTAILQPKMKYDLNDGNWHHIAVSMPRKSCNLSEVMMFVDGKAINTITDKNEANIFFVTSGRLSIGGFGYSHESYEAKFPHLSPFIGAVDEFYMWGRALTGDDLRVLMQI